MVDYALATLEALAGCEAGLVSLREEGGQVGLWRSARGRWPRATCGLGAPAVWGHLVFCRERLLSLHLLAPRRRL